MEFGSPSPWASQSQVQFLDRISRETRSLIAFEARLV